MKRKYELEIQQVRDSVANQICYGPKGYVIESNFFSKYILRDIVLCEKQVHTDE